MIITIDCEGTNYDDDLKGSIECMSGFLDLCLEYNCKVILFITGIFADEFFRQGMYAKYKDRVLFGLHIHPENLPESITGCLDFSTDKEMLADYDLEQKQEIIKRSYVYLKDLGVENLSYFRGGQFSCDNDILEYLDANCPDILFESHNIFRSEFKVNKEAGVQKYLGRIQALPVTSHEDTSYLCLENMTYEELVRECEHFGFYKVVMLTHSYMFRENAFRYKRDNIAEHISIKLKRLFMAYTVSA